jgi:hypothetical protein
VLESPARSQAGKGLENLHGAGDHVPATDRFRHLALRPAHVTCQRGAASLRYASRKYWAPLSRDLRPIYTAADETAAAAALETFAAA